MLPASTAGGLLLLLLHLMTLRDVSILLALLMHLWFRCGLPLARSRVAMVHLPFWCVEFYFVLSTEGQLYFRPSQIAGDSAIGYICLNYRTHLVGDFYNDFITVSILDFRAFSVSINNRNSSGSSASAPLATHAGASPTIPYQNSCCTNTHTSCQAGKRYEGWARSDYHHSDLASRRLSLRK